VLQRSAGNDLGMVTIETNHIQTGAAIRLQCPLTYLRRIWI